MLNTQPIFLLAAITSSIKILSTSTVIAAAAVKEASVFHNVYVSQVALSESEVATAKRTTAKQSDVPVSVTSNSVIPNYARDVSVATTRRTSAETTKFS